MKFIKQTGKFFYIIAIVGLGIEHFVTRNFPTALLPVPDSMPDRLFFVYFTGIVFIASAVCIAINKLIKSAAVTLGLLLLLLIIYPHLPNLVSSPYDPNEWTAFLEVTSLCAGAFIIAGSFGNEFSFNHNKSKIFYTILKIARYVFAIAFLCFGIQHFMYTAFILTLIPAWIPFPNFWEILIKITFIATSLSLIFNIQTRLTSALAGIMFLMWVIFLHIPLVASNSHTETQWTSLFIAIAMCGICFMIAGTSLKKIAV